MNLENKNLEFALAQPGSIGLEACFGILCSLFPLEQVIKFLTRGKSLFSIPQNSIAEGQKADITFFNPNKRFTLTKSDLTSTSKNCAFVGHQMNGKVLGCFNNNQLQWNADTLV